MILPIIPWEDTPNFPKPPKRKNSFINCWWNIRGTFQGYVGEILEIGYIWKLYTKYIPFISRWNNYHLPTIDPNKPGTRDIQGAPGRTVLSRLHCQVRRYSPWKALERNMGFTSSIYGYLELGDLHYMEVQHHNVMRYDDLIIYDDIWWWFQDIWWSYDVLMMIHDFIMLIYDPELVCVCPLFKRIRKLQSNQHKPTISREGWSTYDWWRSRMT